MTKQLALRYTEDPFTIALARIFRSEHGERVRTLMENQMPSLVKQVAISMGLTASDQIIREEAISVFTGTISLHLASLTKNNADVDRWAIEIIGTDLKTLFRRGFTMASELAKFPYSGLAGTNSVEDSLGPLQATPIDILARISRWREDGVWNGYGLYVTESNHGAALQRASLLAEWLIIESARLAGKPVKRELYRLLLLDHVIARALVNIVRVGKISVDLEGDDIKRLASKARKKKTWKKVVENGLKEFFTLVPEKHHQYLKKDDAVRYWQKMMGELGDKSCPMEDVMQVFAENAGIEYYGSSDD